MSRVLLRAPAKINLFLHITGRRADGYHLLQSVFRAVNLFDELDLQSNDSGQITRDVGPASVPAETDLVVRAAMCLREFLALKHERDVSSMGVSINVQKRIPMGAGLGGGSSDAAAVLVALNRLWQANLNATELASLALQLGADVPFFLNGADAWVEGIGEQITPITLARAFYVIVFPNVHCPTPKLFADPDLKRHCAPITQAEFLQGAPTENVFEAIACKRFPEISRALDWLKDAAGNARMTGSGSAIFACVNDQQQAVRIKHACPDEWQAFFASSVV
jgi:4-diphosphocytidyl-2-C-methyl-D-erythritol kinase